MNLNTQFRGTPQGRLAQKNHIEEQLEEALAKKDYEKSEQLNTLLVNFNLYKDIKAAKTCLEYDTDMKVEEAKQRSKKKPKLNWGFDSKQRWERKGNM